MPAYSPPSSLASAGATDSAGAGAGASAGAADSASAGAGDSAGVVASAGASTSLTVCSAAAFSAAAFSAAAFSPRAFKRWISWWTSPSCRRKSTHWSSWAFSLSDGSANNRKAWPTSSWQCRLRNDSISIAICLCVSSA
ncbi:hypothetical protein D5687_10895 [Guyparkeria sp. SCN-R1]|nr:hypothetical protein D5687_10895 [Guyparkeria sp. SCN-R1]